MDLTEQRVHGIWSRRYRQIFPSHEVAVQITTSPLLFQEPRLVAKAQEADGVRILIAPRPPGELYGAMCDMVANTSERLYVEDQFFSPAPLFSSSSRLLNEIKAALVRGVKITVVTNPLYLGTSQTALYSRSLLRLMLDLRLENLHHGLSVLFVDERRSFGEVAFRPVYVHSKVWISDGVRCLVGSANVCGRSFAWDQEVTVELSTRFSREILDFEEQLLGLHGIGRRDGPYMVSPLSLPGDIRVRHNYIRRSVARIVDPVASEFFW